MGELRSWLDCRTIFQAEQDLECYVELFERYIRFMAMKEPYAYGDVLDALSMRTLSWRMRVLGKSQVGYTTFSTHT